MRWTFLRAFGPTQHPWREALDGERASQQARALHLQARILARSPLQTVADEVGRRVALSLFQDQAVIAARTNALAELAAELARWANDEGRPLALLKFAALHAAGVLPQGGRPASDIDVLVPESHLSTWTARLCDGGFHVHKTVEQGHQLAPLVDSGGRVVELHRHVPGVRLPGRRKFATFEALEQAGLLQPAPRLACLIPSPALAAAHAVVHGLAQHGATPDAYPLARLPADGIDLGLASGRLDHAHELIGDEVSVEEWQATVRLCQRLEAGDAGLFASGAAHSPEVLLLRHIVAGVTDRRYVRALRPAAVLGTLVEDVGWRRAVRGTWQALWLSDRQIDGIYGAPRSRGGYLLRRLRRPFDLAVRLLRSLWSGAVVRRPRP